MKVGATSLYLKTLHSGAAIVEFTIAIPIFVTLMFSVVAVTQAYQANSIIINMSREGANIASRNFVESPQTIINALALSATPLDFSDDGIIYISMVVADDNSIPHIHEQYRLSNGGFSVGSRIWDGCSRWEADGACDIPDKKPNITNFPLALDPGEVVFAVEVNYDHKVFMPFSDRTSMELYSLTLM